LGNLLRELIQKLGLFETTTTAFDFEIFNFVSKSAIDLTCSTKILNSRLKKFISVILGISENAAILTLIPPLSAR
jgi:hypothetical protein